MKRPGIILIVIVLGLAAGYGLYRWYLTTPVYALVQISTAVKTHDWEGFTTFVDVDSVARGAAQDISLIAEEAMAGKKLSRIITKGLSTLLAIKVRTTLRDDLKGWVTGVPPEKKGLLGAILPPPQAQEGKQRLKGISWKDDAATARIGLGPDAILVLEMKKDGATWRVTRVLNVREIYEQSRQKKS